MEIPRKLAGQRIIGVSRRAKYLLLELDSGALLIHLGMSGNLRVYSKTIPEPDKHDHVDFYFEGGVCLRYHDPRRFGSIHWQDSPVLEHWLLESLGPEPLSSDFNGPYLKAVARGRMTPVKNFIMNSQIVVGVGNIYANEALFLARIRPTAQARRISKKAYDELVLSIKDVLLNAIDRGGTTLRDFVDQEGNPGYFEQSLYVYGRHGQPCKKCGALLKGVRLSQRASTYCPSCQNRP